MARVVVATAALVVVAVVVETYIAVVTSESIHSSLVFALVIALSVRVSSIAMLVPDGTEGELRVGVVSSNV